MSSQGTTTIPGAPVCSYWMLVAPDDARRFLEANTSNRRIRPVHLAKVIDDMKADRYQITHQGIAFDVNGILLDGQHRPKAIVETSRAQWLLVTTGLPPEAQQEMDGGAKRAASDFMEGRYSPARSSAARLLIAARSTGERFTVNELGQALSFVTTAQILSIDNVTADLLMLFAGTAVAAARNTPAIGASALLAAAARYPETGGPFLDGIRSMAGLNQGDPRLAVLRFRGGDKRIQQPVSGFAAFKGARAFARGDSLMTLRIGGIEEINLRVSA